MRSTRSWWASKTRQFRHHLAARVRPGERAALSSWTTPAERAVFDDMHVADQRHGLDVVARLRSDDLAERDVLVAGLLHDAGKGRIGVWPRVAWSLGEAYGGWVWQLARVMPGFGQAIDTLRDHAERSADMAAAAGCSELTVELIRHQAAPQDTRFGELLRLADEAS